MRDGTAFIGWNGTGKWGVSVSNDDDDVMTTMTRAEPEMEGLLCDLLWADPSDDPGVTNVESLSDQVQCTYHTYKYRVWRHMFCQGNSSLSFFSTFRLRACVYKSYSSRVIDIEVCAVL